MNLNFTMPRSIRKKLGQDLQELRSYNHRWRDNEGDDRRWRDKDEKERDRTISQFRAPSAKSLVKTFKSSHLDVAMEQALATAFSHVESLGAKPGAH